MAFVVMDTATILPIMARAFSEHNSENKYGGLPGKKKFNNKQEKFELI